jgi:hypothetical protein
LLHQTMLFAIHNMCDSEHQARERRILQSQTWNKRVLIK